MIAERLIQFIITAGQKKKERTREKHEKGEGKNCQSEEDLKDKLHKLVHDKGRDR